MEIKLKEITIKDLWEGYENNEELGVVAYGGKLDVRPPYQREFIYKPEQQREVIKTVSKNFPLNVMYWATRDDGTFEVIDGQQRTMSICEYLEGNFSVDFRKDDHPMTFGGLQPDKQKAILDYKLTVYVCTGEASEKLDWFETINIAGEKLTEQELRNAVYSGPFVTEAKKKFSKTGCVAYKLGNKYMSGSCIRQEYLETVIEWINGGDVSGYMSKHQNDKNADGTFYMYDEIESTLRNSGWRLPTKAEFEELITLAPNDYRQRKRYNMTFTSVNGSSITLPTPGVMVRGELHYIDEKGSYIGTNGSDVYSLDISLNSAKTRFAFKDSVFAYLVRAVQDKK